MSEQAAAEAKLASEANTLTASLDQSGQDLEGLFAKIQRFAGWDCVGSADTVLRVKDRPHVAFVLFARLFAGWFIRLLSFCVAFAYVVCCVSRFCSAFDSKACEASEFGREALGASEAVGQTALDLKKALEAQTAQLEVCCLGGGLV